MNCPQCSQPVEAGAAFCGNCGQALRPVRAAAAVAGAPSYALAVPGQQSGQLKAMVSLLLGITGIVGGLFMAVFGLVLGIIGLIFGTLARGSYKRGLTTVGIIASSLAILTGLGVWIYAIQHDPRFNNSATPTAHSLNTPAVAAANLTTPCYSAGFIDQLNVSHSSGSCDMSAYNGQALTSSTNAYKVYADKTQLASANAFIPVAKNALEKDVKDNLTGFVVDSERIGSFAGSPAYFINASDKAHNVTVVEAAVLHGTGNGDNVFILVHATSGVATDLDILEAQWQWN